MKISLLIRLLKAKAAQLGIDEHARDDFRSLLTDFLENTTIGDEKIERNTATQNLLFQSLAAVVYYAVENQKFHDQYSLEGVAENFTEVDAKTLEHYAAIAFSDEEGQLRPERTVHDQVGVIAQEQTIKAFLDKQLKLLDQEENTQYNVHLVALINDFMRSIPEEVLRADPKEHKNLQLLMQCISDVVNNKPEGLLQCDSVTAFSEFLQRRAVGASNSEDAYKNEYEVEAAGGNEYQASLETLEKEIMAIYKQFAEGEEDSEEYIENNFYQIHCDVSRLLNEKGFDSEIKQQLLPLMQKLEERCIEMQERLTAIQKAVFDRLKEVTLVESTFFHLNLKNVHGDDREKFRNIKEKIKKASEKNFNKVASSYNSLAQEEAGLLQLQKEVDSLISNYKGEISRAIEHLAQAYGIAVPGFNLALESDKRALSLFLTDVSKSAKVRVEAIKSRTLDVDVFHKSQELVNRLEEKPDDFRCLNKCIKFLTEKEGIFKEGRPVEVVLQNCFKGVYQKKIEKIEEWIKGEAEFYDEGQISAIKDRLLGAKQLLERVTNGRHISKNTYVALLNLEKNFLVDVFEGGFSLKKAGYAKPQKSHETKEYYSHGSLVTIEQHLFNIHELMQLVVNYGAYVALRQLHREAAEMKLTLMNSNEQKSIDPERLTKFGDKLSEVCKTAKEEGADLVCQILSFDNEFWYQSFMQYQQFGNSEREISKEDFAAWLLEYDTNGLLTLEDPISLRLELEAYKDKVEKQTLTESEYERLYLIRSVLKSILIRGNLRTIIPGQGDRVDDETQLGVEVKSSELSSDRENSSEDETDYGDFHQSTDETVSSNPKLSFAAELAKEGLETREQQINSALIRVLNSSSVVIELLKYMRLATFCSSKGVVKLMLAQYAHKAQQQKYFDEKFEEAIKLQRSKLSATENKLNTYNEVCDGLATEVVRAVKLIQEQIKYLEECASLSVSQKESIEEMKSFEFKKGITSVEALKQLILFSEMHSETMRALLAEFQQDNPLFYQSDDATTESKEKEFFDVWFEGWFESSWETWLKAMWFSSYSRVTRRGIVRKGEEFLVYKENIQKLENEFCARIPGYSFKVVNNKLIIYPPRGLLFSGKEVIYSLGPEPKDFLRPVNEEAKLISRIDEASEKLVPTDGAVVGLADDIYYSMSTFGFLWGPSGWTQAFVRMLDAMRTKYLPSVKARYGSYAFQHYTSTVDDIRDNKKEEVKQHLRKFMLAELNSGDDAEIQLESFDKAEESIDAALKKGVKKEISTHVKRDFESYNKGLSLDSSSEEDSSSDEEEEDQRPSSPGLSD